MEKEKLVRAAYQAKEFSYAPYSNFHVGAALLGESGRVYLGCNIENALFLKRYRKGRENLRP